jgi:hypothetical protein
MTGIVWCDDKHFDCSNAVHSQLDIYSLAITPLISTAKKILTSQKIPLHGAIHQEFSTFHPVSFFLHVLNQEFSSLHLMVCFHANTLKELCVRNLKLEQPK